MTLFINIKYGNVAVKASRNEQRSVIRFLWANWDWKCYCTHPPDLASSDYRLYGPMKKMLGGQKFASDTEVQSTVRQNRMTPFCNLFMERPSYYKL